MGNEKGKGIGKKGNTSEHSLGYEYHGVGMALSPRALAANLDFEQINGRQMYVLQKSDIRHICIINGYAPQSKRPPSEKDRFYEELEQTFRTFQSNYITIILGDFNARLHYRLDTEKEIFGPNMFGRGE